MIVEYIRYAVPATDATTFERDYATAAEHLAADANCLGWELARAADEPGAYTLRIEWVSASGHMDEFRKGPNFPPFFRAIRPWVGAIQEMRHYEVTDVTGRPPTPTGR